MKSSILNNDLADITSWKLPCHQRGEMGGYKMDRQSRARKVICILSQNQFCSFLRKIFIAYFACNCTNGQNFRLLLLYICPTASILRPKSAILSIFNGQLMVFMVKFIIGIVNKFSLGII